MDNMSKEEFYSGIEGFKKRKRRDALIIFGLFIEWFETFDNDIIDLGFYK